MRDDLDVLEDMVEDDDGVAEHEGGFGNAEGIDQLASGLGLKVLYAVIRDIADGTTWKE